MKVISLIPSGKPAGLPAENFMTSMKKLQPRVMAEPVNRETEFALQVDDKFDKYWIQGGKHYMQRGGEPVWHEISQVKYDKAYENYCYLRILNSR